MNSTVMMVAALAWTVMLLSLAYLAAERLPDRNEETDCRNGREYAEACKLIDC
jgi:hypothetical protein